MLQSDSFGMPQQHQCHVLSLFTNSYCVSEDVPSGWVLYSERNQRDEISIKSRLFLIESNDISWSENEDRFSEFSSETSIF